MRKALIIFLAVLGVETAMAYEEPEYEVLLETRDYEIREYATHIVAEVDVTGSMKNSGDSGFRLLADYIFGNNARNEKMSMTAPVETSEAEGDRHTYAFMMERRYGLGELPEPVDARIRLSERPSRVMAVRRYSGSWRESNFRKNAAELQRALDAHGREYRGRLILARYDSPVTPWFLRRNEVMVELPQQATSRLDYREP